MAIAHKDDRIKVSILCPQAVDTPLLHGLPPGPQSRDGILAPAQVAQAAIEGIERETFMILPHAEVKDYIRTKMEDRDRSIDAQARLQRRILDAEIIDAKTEGFSARIRVASDGETDQR